MLNTARVSQEVSAEISEVFSSLQGEGPYLGSKQIFVRFGRCNMHCVYCDEHIKMQSPNFKRLSLSHTLDRITTVERQAGSHHSVSLTGGEPLFYPRFVQALIPQLKAQGLPVYLETNGTLPKVLEQVITDVDYIAMDWKLPSSSGDRAYWQEHQDFLRISTQKKVFVKMVITATTKVEEVALAIERIHAVSPEIPLIFQPESETVGISLKALEKIKLECYPRARCMTDVRVIPQMHKIWGIR